MENHSLLPDQPDAGLDPRTAILAAIVITAVVLSLDSYSALALAWAFGAAACSIAWTPLTAVVARLIAINAFMFVLVLLLPWGVPGWPLAALGPYRYSYEGFHQAAVIALQGNAIALWLTAFFARLDPMRFGQGLAALGAPRRLAALFLLTVRYLAVIQDEYLVLRRAMAIRAFQPRLDYHTLRSYGYLVGMLLVRALERSERVYAAMRCRGFNGALPRPAHMRFAAADGFVAAGVFFCAAAALWTEWS